MICYFISMNQLEWKATWLIWFERAANVASSMLKNNSDGSLFQIIIWWIIKLLSDKIWSNYLIKNYYPINNCGHTWVKIRSVDLWKWRRLNYRVNQISSVIRLFPGAQNSDLCAYTTHEPCYFFSICIQISVSGLTSVNCRVTSRDKTKFRNWLHHPVSVEFCPHFYIRTRTERNKRGKYCEICQRRDCCCLLKLFRVS